MMSELRTKPPARAAVSEPRIEQIKQYARAEEPVHASADSSSASTHASASHRRRSSDASDEDQLTLNAVEEKLRLASRENELLKSRNRQLTSALADASQRGTEAHHLAHHDGLTGLPNRLLLMARLRDNISIASRTQSQVALLFIDLDDFKSVNDRLGHSVGDKLLSVVAARILASIRADDIACRYGGDEFVILMSEIRDSALVSSIAEKIRKRINGCYGIDDDEVRISASVGFAVYPTDGDTCDALLKFADASMYRSKAAGRRERPNESSSEHRSLGDARGELTIPQDDEIDAGLAAQQASFRQSASRTPGGADPRGRQLAGERPGRRSRHT